MQTSNYVAADNTTGAWLTTEGQLTCSHGCGYRLVDIIAEDTFWALKLGGSKVAGFSASTVLAKPSLTQLVVRRGTCYGTVTTYRQDHAHEYAQQDEVNHTS